MDLDREIKIGKYRLKSRLGKGGMGVVYLATDSRLKRDVALKILPKSLATDAIAVKRFLREARVAAQLSHPNIVTIHDVDQFNGQCFLVMELMNGGTAYDLMQRGPLDWWDATRIIADTCRGLIAIHEAGLIHRDIKPSNIMLAAIGTVKLADFGLAKVTAASDSNRLTVPSAIMGTPQFMSPEQCQGEELDARCDLYSLGATYYALLTGEAPFPDTQPLQCMFAHCSKPIPDPRHIRSEIPEACARIVMKALSKQRMDRFTSAHDMLAALKDSLNAVPSASSRLSWISQPFSNPHSTSGHLSTESAASITSSDAPETQALPLIDPHQTVAISESRPRTARRWKIPLVAGGIVAVLLIFVIYWNGTGPRTARQGSAGQSTLKRSGPSGSQPFRHGDSTGIKQESDPITEQGSDSGDRMVGQTCKLEFDKAFPGIDTQVSGVVFSSDGNSVYSGSMDAAVRQWDLQGRKLRTFEGTQQGIRAIATHGDWLVAGGTAKTVWVWRLTSDQPAAELGDFQGEISALSISPDGQRLAIGTYSEVRLYELFTEGPRLIKVLGTSTSSTVSCYMVMSVTFSADNRWVAATSWTDHTVAVWDAQTGELREVKQRQAREPIALAFLPGQDRVLFGSHDQGLYFWDLQGSIVSPLTHSLPKPGQSLGIRSLAVSPDGQSVFTIGEWGGGIRQFDLRSNRPPVISHKATATSSLGLAISPDGTRLVMSGGEPNRQKGFIHLWKIARERAE